MSLYTAIKIYIILLLRHNLTIILTLKNYTQSSCKFAFCQPLSCLSTINTFAYVSMVSIISSDIITIGHLYTSIRWQRNIIFHTYIRCKMAVETDIDAFVWFILQCVATFVNAPKPTLPNPIESLHINSCFPMTIIIFLSSSSVWF